MADDSDMIDMDGSKVESARVQIAPIPRISMQAFCETPAVAEMIDDASIDRRMAKAHVKVHMGGAGAAVEAYRSAPTPNLMVLEAGDNRDELLQHLDDLAELCDPGSKVIVIGRINDIVLFRELIARGISDYLITPVDTLTFIQTISTLYGDPEGEPLGKVIAVTGAKGGVGASCLAHNLAWEISREFDLSTVIADVDLAFGTAGLDFNQDPPQGIAEAIFAPDRLDANLVDRLLSKCTDRLSLLAAPATLDRVYDFDEAAFDGLIDILRSTTPLVVMDVPQMWISWSKRLLVGADDVVIVASPDLANLRNAKNLIDTLRAARPNDSAPKLVMNMVGVPKRPEISVADFAKALELAPVGAIPFEPKLFGTAANNGQMLGEVEQGNKITETVGEIAMSLMGRAEQKAPKKKLSLPFVSRLRGK
ncbi:MAG: CpaE family protein [Beijerinckiaceae bacterium]